MKAIVTVIGKDTVGIIAAVCALLAKHGVNVLDISQTVMQEYFTMIMMVDLTGCTASFADLAGELERSGKERGLSIRIQREDIFQAMHRTQQRGCGKRTALVVVSGNDYAYAADKDNGTSVRGHRATTTLLLSDVKLPSMIEID